jgi:HK97 family phage major capsid protein
MKLINSPGVPAPEYRATLLELAGALIGKSNFTKEDSARADVALRLAEQIGLDGRAKNPEEEARRQVVAHMLKTHRGGIYGRRDLNMLSPTQSISTSVLVAQQFYGMLLVILKAFSALFDPDVVRFWTAGTGAGAALPGIDVTGSPAAKISEGDTDPTDAATVLTGVALPSAPLYRTPLLAVSRELLEDSNFDIAQVLTLVQGLQLGLGIGPDLVTTLLSTALLGATATGSAANTGGSETGANSIGWADLVALRKSVNPAYRIGPKVGWLMNDSTLASLDSLIDKSGRPVLPQIYENGRRVLMGFPVFISPEMPSIGAGAEPVAFGNFDFFVVRTVPDSLVLRILQERYAEYGKIAYFSKLRANGALLGVTSTDSPVKLLANAS